MGKLLLLSILVAPILIPARAARLKDARAGLKRTLKQMALFNLFYLFVMLFLYGRL